MSEKGRVRLNKLSMLIRFLAEYRAKGVCEICGKKPDFRGLNGAHIGKRKYDGSNDTLWNIIIACARCHDHTEYPDYEYGGLCITKEKARDIVRRRNEIYGIEELYKQKIKELEG